jgi:hypothetical protein
MHFANRFPSDLFSQYSTHREFLISLLQQRPRIMRKASNRRHYRTPTPAKPHFSPTNEHSSKNDPFFPTCSKLPILKPFAQPEALSIIDYPIGYNNNEIAAPCLPEIKKLPHRIKFKGKTRSKPTSDYLEKDDNFKDFIIKVPSYPVRGGKKQKASDGTLYASTKCKETVKEETSKQRISPILNPPKPASTNMLVFPVVKTEHPRKKSLEFEDISELTGWKNEPTFYNC